MSVAFISFVTVYAVEECKLATALNSVSWPNENVGAQYVGWKLDRKHSGVQSPQLLEKTRGHSLLARPNNQLPSVTCCYRRWVSSLKITVSMWHIVCRKYAVNSISAGVNQIDFTQHLHRPINNCPLQTDGASDWWVLTA